MPRIISAGINTSVKRNRQDNFGSSLDVVVEDVLTSPYVAAMSVPPTSSQRSTIDRLYKSLRTANLLTKLDRLYLLHSHDEQASRLNFINPAETALSTVNAPTFDPFVGWTGDSATQHMFQPGPYAFTGAKFQLNSACIGFGVGATSGSGARAMVGNNSGTLNSHTLQTGVSNTLVRMNDATSLPIPASSHAGSRSGSFLSSRLSATERKFYVAGLSLATDAVAPTAVADVVATLMKNAAAYTADTFWYYLSGGGLTDVEAAALNTALTTYRSEYVA